MTADWQEQVAAAWGDHTITVWEDHQDRDWVWDCDCGWRGIDPKAHRREVVAPIIRAAQSAAWNEGYTVGNAHNGRRDANPYTETGDAQ